MNEKRLAALEAVAAAARKVHRQIEEPGYRADKWFEAKEALRDAFKAIDVLPPPAEVAEPAATGGMVEVRAVVLMSPDGANWTVFGRDVDETDDAAERGARLRHLPDDEEMRAATITARIPMPGTPTIPATVELAP